MASAHMDLVPYCPAPGIVSAPVLTGFRPFVRDKSLVAFTEYPSPTFLDLFTFNVYLETEEKLSSYIDRLHNPAGDLPVLVAETELDGFRDGKDKEAHTLDHKFKSFSNPGALARLYYSWTQDLVLGGV
jgi:hypothetical protein